MLGYTQKEALIKWTDLATDHPINEIGFQNTVRAIETGEPQPPYELELKHKNGQKVFVEVREAPVIVDGKTVSIVGALSDITQRKNAEEALKSSENKYRSLFENANDAIFLLKNSIWIDCNTTTEKMFGYYKNEMIGMSPVQVSPEFQHDGRRSDEKAIEKISDALKGYPQFFEWIHTRKDGSEFSTEVSLNKIEINDQIMLLAIVRDITERKQSEEALAEKEKHYRTLFDLSPAGILIEDSNGNILDLNESFCRNSGYKREEVIGKNVSILGPREREGDIKKNIDEILSGTELEHDVINRKKDGSLGYLRLRECSITLPDGSLGILCVANDVTERKEAERALFKSEKRYRNFFEEDISGNFISTPAGKILECNSAFVRMFGFNSKEEVFSFDASDFYLDPNSREQFLKELKEKRSIDLWGTELKRKDGSQIFTSEHTVGIFDDNGELGKIQGYIFDITELIKTQRELIKAKEAAESANKLKDAFIANMSHEIRTPLNGILGMTSLIKESFEKYSTGENREYFAAIDIASRRIIRTIDMILNFSRLQVGDFPTSFKMVELSKLIKDLVDEYKFAAESRSLTLSFVNDIGKLEQYADEYSLTQALSNLLDNAIKYTKNGFVKILLYKDISGKIKIDIQDSGIGMSEEYLKGLFQPYSQEEIGYSRGYEGVGLGLSLVKKFLDLNNADISIKSTKGKGSTFSISMDFIEERTSDSDTIQEEVISRLDNEDKLVAEKIHTVLVVEDDTVNQGFIRAIVNRVGKMNPFCVDNAAEALKVLENEKVDLILMDISLRGEMNGLELTKLLRKNDKYKDLPIIAVTAHAFPTDRQVTIEAGCNDYLAKPFSSQELIDKINTALRLV